MSDTVARLRELASLKTGDSLPEWLPTNDWGTPLSELARQAADEIEELRRWKAACQAKCGYE